MSEPQSLPDVDHGALLSTLSRVDAEMLKSFAEPLIADLGDIEVIENRTGRVMLPMADTAQGTHFHLGEVLVSEARISAAGQDGYGMRRGRDLSAAMAMALVDVAVAAGVKTADISAFMEKAEAALQAEEHDRLTRVEATRVDMETF